MKKKLLAMILQHNSMHTKVRAIQKEMVNKFKNILDYLGIFAMILIWWCVLGVQIFIGHILLVVSGVVVAECLILDHSRSLLIHLSYFGK